MLVNKIGISIMNTTQSTYETGGKGTCPKASLSPVGSSWKIESKSKSPAVIDKILSNDWDGLENGECLVMKKSEDSFVFFVTYLILPEYQAE